MAKAALWVHAQTRGKAVVHTAFEGQRDRVQAADDAHSYAVSECPP
jgi:hypothetical protein